MNVTLKESQGVIDKKISMQKFGELFIRGLDKHVASLNIANRFTVGDVRAKPISAKVDNRTQTQKVMLEVLCDPITQEAHSYAELAFRAFLEKERVDVGLLRFFNGWNETHKTTSLVSAKVAVRLSAGSIFVSSEKQNTYALAMAHMHEVVRDDMGLGHPGHDGMYEVMAAAFNAVGWSGKKYAMAECIDFSSFLYETGVENHSAAIHSDAYMRSLLKAMMVSVSSEIWNGREYNYFAQFIEGKLLSINPLLVSQSKSLREAKSYVIGHAGQVENRHGLHALAAAQAYASSWDLGFEPASLGEVMLDYNKRVGIAFCALCNVLG
ncbi:hypothetical protein ACIGCH_20620 [Pseudomonas helleri]|uniref:Uncharacterized protein n=1 Tax=Pseudomonas helleri TaxID=1608996 RepID=A0A6A7Z0F8_9PSED|nr:hypothetical protein [Pseudomonas helleri]MQT27737.1 hypothetical protein [Pseudomonas helleri]MQT81019.1 hypothetical protein [Pseudomonas helleri]MQU18573.1 hypothetical protein [Pseudomonas helleri]MQU28576.1 hypothetical protein [Pseudomonas helleri]